MIDLKFILGKITQRFNGDFEVTLVIPKAEKTNIEALNLLLNDEKKKECKIGYYRQKRSLNSNSYAWKLCTEIANVLRSNKDDVYLQMLKRYGQSSVVSVIDEAVPMFLKSVKYTEIFGHGKVNGKNFTHIKVFVGSSSFDTREMSIFLDGIISECTELKIPTLTPAEIEKLKENWEGIKHIE